MHCSPLDRKLCQSDPFPVANSGLDDACLDAHLDPNSDPDAKCNPYFDSDAGPNPNALANPTSNSDANLLGTRVSAPEQQGMSSELLTRMVDDIGAKSVVVIRNGYMVMEAYFYPFRRNARHNIYSCTKSFTSALLGIAIAEGYVDELDHRVLDYFPDRTIENDDPRKRAMTLEHLLTMRCGLDWPEASVPYSSSHNILVEMLQTPDWVQFVLDRPMVTEPGTSFNYNTGCSHLLSAVVREAIGMNASSFARTHLFGPLGISAVTWSSDPAGITFGGGGIWMRPRYMAKFGLLYLDKGVWNGEQIVPADWVEASVSGSSYGYSWWMYGNGAYAAHGYRGQRIIVVPDLDMVVVMVGAIAGNTPRYLLDAYIIPAAQSSDPLPENPEGLTLLEERVDAVAQP